MSENITKKQQFIQAVKDLRNALEKFYELDKAWYDTYQANIEAYGKAYPKIFKTTEIDRTGCFNRNFLHFIFKSYCVHRFKTWFENTYLYKRLTVKRKKEIYQTNQSVYDDYLVTHIEYKIDNNTFCFNFPYILNEEELQRTSKTYYFKRFFPPLVLLRNTGASSYTRSDSMLSSNNNIIGAEKTGISEIVYPFSLKKVLYKLVKQAEQEIPLDINRFCELIRNISSDMNPLKEQIIQVLCEINTAKNRLLSVYYDINVVSKFNETALRATDTSLITLFPTLQHTTEHLRVVKVLDYLLDCTNKLLTITEYNSGLRLNAVVIGRTTLSNLFNIISDETIDMLEHCIQDEYIPTKEGFIRYALTIYNSFEQKTKTTEQIIREVKAKIQKFDILWVSTSERRNIDFFLILKEEILEIVESLNYYTSVKEKLQSNFLKPFEADTPYFFNLIKVILKKSSWNEPSNKTLNLLNLMTFCQVNSYYFKIVASSFKTELFFIFDKIYTNQASIVSFSLDLVKLLYVMEMCYNYRTQQHIYDNDNYIIDLNI